MTGLRTWMLGYLVNSVWQVPVVFCAAWVAARLVRRMGPQRQHILWVLTLFAEVLLPACSWHAADIFRRLLSWFEQGTAERGNIQVLVGAGTLHSRGLFHLPAGLLDLIVVAYAASVIYGVGRVCWAIGQTERMRRSAIAVPLTGEFAAIWSRCSQQLSLPASTIALSSTIPGPATIGLRHGVVLVPQGFLDRLGREDFEAVAAHELSHVQRYDFLKNLLYTLAAAPAAYHPLLWRTRSSVAESREMVCDAMAAEVCSGRARYARSLLRLAAMLAATTRPFNTLHAIGIFDANRFERRVMNLMEDRLEVRGAQRVAVLALCVVMGLATCASALALRVEAPAAPRNTQRGDNPVRVSGGVMAGNNFSKVTPVYPPEAKAAKITGAVVLHAVIGKEGAVEQLQVVSGPEQLRASALEAVRQWTYKPYVLNGEPVAVDTTITVNYSLSR